MKDLCISGGDSRFDTVAGDAAKAASEKVRSSFVELMVDIPWNEGFEVLTVKVIGFAPPERVPCLSQRRGTRTQFWRHARRPTGRR